MLKETQRKDIKLEEIMERNISFNVIEKDAKKIKRKIEVDAPVSQVTYHATATRLPLKASTASIEKLTNRLAEILRQEASHQNGDQEEEEDDFGT